FRRASPANTTISSSTTPVPIAMAHHKSATERVTSLAGCSVDKGPSTQPTNKGTRAISSITAFKYRHFPGPVSKRHEGCPVRSDVLPSSTRLDNDMKKLGHP